MNQFRVNKEHAKPSRSRPVSCQFCRARKLRCNRQFPCPNCTSRGITCQLYETSPASAGTENAPDASSGSSNADILARLRRLEDIVGGTRPADAPSGPAPTLSPRAIPPANGEHASITSPQQHSSTTDADRLECEITHPESSSSLLAYEIEFRTCSIRNAPDLSCHSTLATKCMWLPFQEESQKIVEKYLADVTYLHHVVHTPSVRALVDDIYQDLRESKPVKTGHLALLLGIISSTTFLWTERDMHYSLFSTVEEANGQSAQWMKLALEALDYSRRTRSESIEDVQAMIIVFFVVFNLMGINSQARCLIPTAISVAKQLSLHRIDHPQNVATDLPPPDSVRAEIGRRVWWYLVATDWQTSQFAGPQKGTYTINPRHMVTKKPVNANDEDLIDGMIGVGQSSDQPTSNSYCLQRIRLAEICREIADTAPLATSESAAPTFQQVKEIDVKLCEFAESLPSFFSLEYDSHDLPETDPRKSPGIIIQRYLILPLLYAQRCRLHLPYLSRASKEPAYAYSREACLQAARMVIRVQRQLSTEKIPFAWVRLKFSDSQPHEKSAAGTDIFDAFAILEEAKEQSPFAGKLFESLKAVFRQHNVPICSLEGSTTVSTDHKATSDGSTMSVAGSANGNTDNTFLDPALPTLDELWQAFDDNMDSAAVDWNVLFPELDAPM